MTFPTKLLAPGEEVYLDSRPHWSLLFWPSVLTVLVFAACIAVIVHWPNAPIWTAWVLLGVAAVALLNLLARYVSWRTKSFVVTSRRIVYRTGLVRRTGREIPIARVQDVTYHQTVVERCVRAGSLTVESAGREGQDPFPDIRRPARRAVPHQPRHRPVRRRLPGRAGSRARAVRPRRTGAGRGHPGRGHTVPYCATDPAGPADCGCSDLVSCVTSNHGSDAPYRAGADLDPAADNRPAAEGAGRPAQARR